MRVAFFCTHKTYLYAQNEISYEYIQIFLLLNWPNQTVNKLTALVSKLAQSAITSLFENSYYSKHRICPDISLSIFVQTP